VDDVNRISSLLHDNELSESIRAGRGRV